MDWTQEKVRNAAALVVFAYGLFLGLPLFRSLWTLDADGISMLNQKLPYWDFSNLWAGGRLALEGRVMVLFDVEAYRAALRALFTPVLQDQEWSYPPSLLLIGAPLAMLPVLPAYLAWTFGTVFLLHLALRPLQLPPLIHAAVLLSPAVMMDALIGQNGAFTAALLIGGLWLAPRRPFVAGLLFGLLTMKPHLGLLVPFCLLASGNWRAILSAAASTALLVLVTSAIFGWQVWPEFRAVTAPLMTAILEAPYPQPYHTNAMTVFVMIRWLGGGVSIAYAVQVTVSLAAIVVAARMWMPGFAIDPKRRLAITLMLALIATPYGYSYDAVPLAFATAMLGMTERRIPFPVHALVWLFPLFVHVINLHGIGAAILVPLIYAAWNIVLAFRDQARPALEPA